MSRIQQPTALRNQQDFGRKKKKTSRDENPAAATPSPHCPHADLNPWQVRLPHLSLRLPPASIAVAQSQWRSPSKLPTPGSTSSRSSAQPKRAAKRVNKKKSERRRVQRREDEVPTVLLDTSTALDPHVRISTQGSGHDSSAGHPGKNTHTAPVSIRKPIQVLGTEHAQWRCPALSGERTGLERAASCR